MRAGRSAFWKLAIGVALFCAAAAGSHWMDNYQLQVMTTLAMLCSLCWAWNLVGGYMGYPSLASATFFGFGAYAAAIAQTEGVSLPMSWTCSALAGACLAGLLGYALLRLKGHYFAIGTIATVEVCRELANNWEGLTGGSVGLNLPILAGQPDAVGKFFYLAMLAVAAIAFLITLFIDNSKLGFGLRCIRQNEQAASMVGIDVVQYKVAAFVLSGTLCAMSGGVYASMVAFIEPKDAFSVLTTIEVPVMVMLGGMGTVFGPLIGGIFYVALKEFVWAYFINWHSGLLGVIVVVVIYFIPAGVFGTNWRAVMRWTRRSEQISR